MTEVIVDNDLIKFKSDHESFKDCSTLQECLELIQEKLIQLESIKPRLVGEDVVMYFEEPIQEPEIQIISNTESSNLILDITTDSNYSIFYSLDGVTWMHWDSSIELPEGEYKLSIQLRDGDNVVFSKFESIIVYPESAYCLRHSDNQYLIDELNKFNLCQSKYGIRYDEIYAIKTLPSGFCNGSDIRDLSGLEKLTSLEVISRNNFSNCKNLHNIEIPKSITEIGEGSFCNCDNLNKVIIYDSKSGGNLVKLDNNTFCNCKSLKYFYIPDTCIKLNNILIGCNNLKSIRNGSSIPQAIGKDFIDNLPRNCSVFVPYTSLDKYRNTNWVKFELYQLGNTLKGKPNGGISYVTSMIDNILNIATDEELVMLGDINGDGKFDISDITEFNNILITI